MKTTEMKKIGSKVRRKLLSYLETREIYELANIDEMNVELQSKILEGQKILNQLIQPKYSPRSEEEIMNMFMFMKDNDNG